MAGSILSIDFGTSNTVAVLHRDGRDGRPGPLIFDGSPLLPSAVCWDPAAGLLVGQDADRAAAAAPARYEPNPKRRIDDGTVWLGEREVTVVDAISAVLREVANEATRTGGGPPDRTVLTHPAVWAGQRLGVLASAAERAGLPRVEFTPEPVAAAAYFVEVLGQRMPPGRCVVVYDFGAGTFDVAVVARTASSFSVLAADGLADVGGLDLDALVVGHIRAAVPADEALGRIDWPQSTADRRHRRLLWQDARAAKEQLSRHPRADLHVPLIEYDHTVTRTEFEQLAAPVLDRTVALTTATLRAARIGPESVAGLFLVGGSSRVPLVASMLHRALGIAPTVIEQPEMVVAEGASHAAGALRPAVAPAQEVLGEPVALITAPAAPPAPEEPAALVPPPAPEEPAALVPPPAPEEPAAAAEPPVDADPPAPRAPTLLRVAAWLSIAFGAVICLGRIVDLTALAASGEIADPRSLAPNFTRTLGDLAMLLLAGILLLGSGRRPWAGGALLVADAILSARYLPRLPDFWAAGHLGSWGSPRLSAVHDVLVPVLAVLAVVALRRMRPPPRYPDPSTGPGAVAILLAVIGSTAYAVANFVVTGATLGFGFQWTWFAVGSAAVVAYAMSGRPAAAAPGLVAAAVLTVVPVVGSLVVEVGDAGKPGMRAGYLVALLTYLAIVPLASVALKDPD